MWHPVIVNDRDLGTDGDGFKDVLLHGCILLRVLSCYSIFLCVLLVANRNYILERPRRLSPHVFFVDVIKPPFRPPAGCSRCLGVDGAG